jgi:hypothetical protein
MEKVLILPNVVAMIRRYEIRHRKDRRGFDLISEALPFGRLWYESRTPRSTTHSFTAVHMTL